MSFTATASPRPKPDEKICTFTKGRGKIHQITALNVNKI